MDSTPPPPSHKSNPNPQSKSASRFSRITYSVPSLSSLDLVPLSPPKETPSSLSRPPNSFPLHELLLLSPSPSRKSRTRLIDRLDMAEETAAEPIGSRRRCKTRVSQSGSLSCASPRNGRRLRKRAEMEIREEKDMLGSAEEIGKTRKRRHSGKTKKDKHSSVLPPPSSPKPDDDCDGGNLDMVGMMIYDLIMWNDVAKSSFWFGIGCLCFLSSFFAKGINFSMCSIICQLGLLSLSASFVSNSICQRNSIEGKRKFKLKDEDILRVGRLILPAANLAISKIRDLFSGEPSMTLKVTPFLLLGAEYGQLVTLRRLCAIGFFTSFTIPKLYACYSTQLNEKVEYAKCRVSEAWGACSHKKIVAASAITAFWNLSSIKTRIFTAFLSLVILRCCRVRLAPRQEEAAAEQVEDDKEAQQALVLADVGTSQKKQS